MGTRKRGTELVFNLQWRNKPDNGGDKSNVIGIYDSPATILNFETFKSYLLKNSGVAGDDVKVTFLTDNGQEWVIDSQITFQIALCAFRLKARLGEVIFLKLDKISHQHNMDRKSCTDVQTQSEYESFQNCLDIAPEWFIGYMQQFKRELVEEVTWAVTSNLTSLQAQNAAKEKEKEPVQLAQPIAGCYKKAKPDYFAKKAKRHNHCETSIDKENLKNYKFERKVEHKLDKLDAKTKKIREKKLALINKTFDFSERVFARLNDVRNEQNGPDVIPNDKSDSTDNDTAANNRPLYDDKGTPLLNAALSHGTPSIPHMLGGETYLHQWHIINNGILPWTNNTELRLTWGSAEMKPSTIVIRCPALIPGEEGRLSVVFQIPKYPGQYESYWNFYDKEVRFGQWLSCCIIVDPPLISSIAKMPEYVNVLPKTTNNGYEPVSMQKAYDAMKTIPCHRERSEALLAKKLDDLKIIDEQPQISHSSPKANYGITESELIVDLSKTSGLPAATATVAQEEQVKIEDDDDNDNNNNNDNNSHRGSIYEISSDSSSVSSGYDVLTAPICDEKEDEDPSSGYVYITINGDKLPVPKYILRPDFLANAEVAPGPLQSLEVQQQLEPPKLESSNNATARLEQEILALEQNIEDTKNMFSHCSAMGSCYSDVNAELNKSRLFIFPRSNPGFEVVNPEARDEQEVTVEAEKENAVASAPIEPIWINSETKYVWPNNDNRNEEYLKYNPYILAQDGTAATSTPLTGCKSESQDKAMPHVPNYQQTLPKPQKPTKLENNTPPTTAPRQPQQPTSPPPPSTPPQVATSPPINNTLNVLPENLVAGAVNVASSAINTARSVINMIVTPKSEGKWQNGHWVGENPESVRAKNLRILTEMGFWDMDLNATLLARYNDDIARVVAELLPQ